MKELILPAALENLEKVLDFINSELEEINCPMKACMQITVSVEEIFVNIANYAYQPGSGLATIRFDAKGNPSVVIIEFSDSGIPYNPLEKADPDVTISAEERSIGGLGIFMVKKSMDNVEYEHKDGKNVLRLYKEI